LRNRSTVGVKAIGLFRRNLIILIFFAILLSVLSFVVLYKYESQYNLRGHLLGENNNGLMHAEDSDQNHKLNSIPLGVAAGGSLQYSSKDDQLEYFELLEALGVHWIRFDFSWSDIQRNGEHAYDWQKYDALVEHANRYGVNVLGMIGYTPYWARNSVCDYSDKCEPADPTKYSNFVNEVVSRYKSEGVSNWEIWNEPNNINFWKPAPNVSKYTEMLDMAYIAAKQADASSNIVSAGLSPATNENKNVAPVDFVKQMYNMGAKNSFDALGFHPYCFHESFNCPVEYADWSAWSQMSDTPSSIRKEMVLNGDEAKKIWITEFGAPTQGYGSVSESQQADELANAYNKLSRVNWTGPMFWYSLQDTGLDSNDSEDWFGLVRANGGKKPAFDVFKSITEKPTY
jgi:polysaccharide biosynthesis protein PslG